jgi:hypothetical protein
MIEPLVIVGVDTDHIGSPRNDNTPGSALYAVPIKLSRRPSAVEAELLVAHWDRPPSFTMMHRPSIAHVVGDTLVLDGTTIEEVRDRHAETLRLVVAATNADAAKHEQAQGERRAAETAAAAAHISKVRDVAAEIKF